MYFFSTTVLGNFALLFLEFYVAQDASKRVRLKMTAAGGRGCVATTGRSRW